MRRKKTECNFRQNVEWLESPEDHGLFLPSRRLFSPNLSKSAPCKCCPSGTQSNNCADCFIAFNALSRVYIDDSVFGNNIASFVPSVTHTVTATVTVKGYSSSLECVNNPGVHDISMPIAYLVTCPGIGPPYHINVQISWTRCGSTPDAMKINIPTSSDSTSASLTLPQYCDLSSSLSFTVSPLGYYDPPTNSHPKLYPSGATITLHQ